MSALQKLDVAEPATVRLALEQLAKLDFLDGRGALFVPTVQVACLAADLAELRFDCPLTALIAFHHVADHPHALMQLLAKQKPHARQEAAAYEAYVGAVATVQRDMAAPDGSPLRLWAVEEPVVAKQRFKPLRWDRALEAADSQLKRLARLAGLGDLV